jgi:hypothetical protein
MAEQLLMPDGAQVKIDASKIEQDFARSMAEPSHDVPGPPKRPADSAEKPQEPRKPRGRPKTTTRTPPAPPAPPVSDQERFEGVTGLVQIGAMLCLAIDQRTPDEDISFKADAIVLSSNAEALGKAVVETAKQNAAFARVVDKVCAAGPYTALVAVTMQIGAQIAVNHGALSEGMLGTVAPQKLVAAVEESGSESASPDSG